VTRQTPSEVHSTSTAPRLEPMWQFYLPNVRNVHARRPEFCDDGGVCLAFWYGDGSVTNSRLIALDRASGAQKWAFEAESCCCNPVVAAGVTYWSSF